MNGLSRSSSSSASLYSSNTFLALGCFRNRLLMELDNSSLTVCSLFHHALTSATGIGYRVRAISIFLVYSKIGVLFE